MKLSLGFSPCPNDTFIFDALIHQKIDTEGLEFEVLFEDVESLNQKAFKGLLDITKLSFHAFAFVLNKYVLLDSGSALGFGVGPLLITKPNSKFKIKNHASYNSENIIYDTDELTSSPVIGIPGKFTTANFLLSTAFPRFQNKKEMLFSNIEDALLHNEIDLGLIIHENRFTYQEKGLVKIIDLGDYWEKLTGCAIPLGGIVIKRSLNKETKLKVNRVVRRSIEFAFANPKSGLEFIRSHAQEMSEDVMYKHIELYVNRYSVTLGEDGRKAVKLLFDMAQKNGTIPDINEAIFLT